MSNSVLPDKTIAEIFSWLQSHEHYVFLDTSKPDELNSQSLLFTSPLETITFHFGQDRDTFYQQVERWLDKGFYCAGWFAYEFLNDSPRDGGSLDGRLGAEFGVYPAPQLLDHPNSKDIFASLSAPEMAEGDYRLENLLANMEEADYYRAIQTILDYIAAGDTYQVNYTFKLNFDFCGSVPRFYRDLRRSQPVPYGCCIRNRDRYILSFSPELFFRAEKDRIIARPMKGTIARGRTVEEDLVNGTMLHGDVKNRSENVMIVDLLRNDLSRLTAATGGGSVHVSSLFDVEQYQSVLQMTSTVVAERREKNGVTPRQIMEAIFPCGSVTGAPKIRTMEIIDELENEPRGVYTGAIGYFSPDHTALFNVPIRTIVLDGTHGEMGIGSGIVADSSPEAEWQECLLKSRFLTDPLPQFEIIETLLHHHQQGYLFLDRHLERLAGSAGYFSFPWEEKSVRSHLSSYAETLSGSTCHRVRLTLSVNGDLQTSATPCGEPGKLVLPALTASVGKPVLVGFAEETSDTTTPWVFHKTTRRERYDLAYEKAGRDGLFDVVFCNERGEVTEGCISNIFILKDGCYYTPPLRCGLLDGIMRRNIIENQLQPPVEEKKLYRDDLLNADRLFLCNSVRGVVPAELRHTSG